MHDYHAFEAQPIFTDVRGLLGAVRRGDVLLPEHNHAEKPNNLTIVHVLNRQWRSMSNTAPFSLAMNISPVADSGRMLFNNTPKGIKPNDCILVSGYRDVLANYLVYVGYKPTRYIYFSLKENKFIRSIKTGQYLIPVRKLLNKVRGIKLFSNIITDDEEKNKALDKDINRIANEIRNKWLTFVYPVRVCRHLTNYQQEGWISALKNNR